MSFLFVGLDVEPDVYTFFVSIYSKITLFENFELNYKCFHTTLTIFERSKVFSTRTVGNSGTGTVVDKYFWFT